ncbi:thioredoxin family protein [Eggerthellaceae bacterium zg-887]|uniref:thioredoxin family protein n=1 Tax=Xiamenia xianingshaonis TaxID=2682776 RepID=UPI00140903C8|nr:thioredoxin family protein [Xiamenia xianingshaonis]NHM16821.1 thioredoxin family protein [Xiamenia xianingshaonis]
MGLLENLFGKSAKSDGDDARIAKASERGGGGSSRGSDGCKRDGDCAITVMGPGCKKCRQLHEHALAASKRLSRPVRVDYVTDPVALADAGITSTPALLIYGKVVSQGRVLTEIDIVALFEKNAG